MTDYTNNNQVLLAVARTKEAKQSTMDVVALSHCDILAEFCLINNLQFRAPGDLPAIAHIAGVGCPQSNQPCFACNAPRRKTKRKAGDSFELSNETEFYSAGEPRELDDLEIDSGLQQLASQLGLVKAADLFFPAPLHSLLFVNQLVEKVIYVHEHEIDL